ncbi:hypothetical protein GCM10023219_31100 [Stakelama sediminis]|uniref:Peptide/nickel transport system substrate-binding protein n=1 Tax=Stakelama sediminis TaxID=463200 RepID=A0A840Z145_9SPHN|nr:ABC transporter substrate-binding protein [Stakelama sediminis]MBB5719698.1 peptide/nickel transport system substrate-binding protein [Stakelama sediminis]
MKRIATALLIAATLALSGCGSASDERQVVVSAIGGPATPADPNKGRMDFPSRVLMGATAQGLVRFDGNGQVEPALAERWIVIDDGTSYIFRLDNDAAWPGGKPVDAEAVARTLSRAAAPGSKNPMAPFLHAVDQVVAMTPQVLEVELSQPRPGLLQLLAQPEMAAFRPGGLNGTGPFRIVDNSKGPGVLLRPVSPADSADEDGTDDSVNAAPPDKRQDVRLIGERASLAIARFADGTSDLVLGGTFRDWPTLELSGVAKNSIKTDPAQGLFGLAVVNRTGFLADAKNRAAIAMALDRDAILGAFTSTWHARTTILPDQLDSAAGPATPDWQGLSADDRLTTARRRVAAWKHALGDKARNGSADTLPGVMPIRVALPDDPGGNLLWARIGPAIHALGLPVMRVKERAQADLRLIDRVAPFDSARWYLRTACVQCSADSETLLDAARDAPNADARAQRLAEADAALTADAAFIPIASPLRWSLVANRLDQWQANARAWHPLNQLRTLPN